MSAPICPQGLASFQLGVVFLAAAVVFEIARWLGVRDFFWGLLVGGVLVLTFMALVLAKVASDPEARKRFVESGRAYAAMKREERRKARQPSGKSAGVEKGPLD